MQSLRAFVTAFFLLTIAWTTAVGQAIDKNLIIGKWGFVKTTAGQHERETEYNGDPVLTFKEDGSWMTEDTNPKYRQKGTWKIENNQLVREAVESGMGTKLPFTYSRVIKKLTETELVFYAAPPAGPPTMTFYFTRVKQ